MMDCQFAHMWSYSAWLFVFKTFLAADDFPTLMVMETNFAFDLLSILAADSSPPPIETNAAISMPSLLIADRVLANTRGDDAFPVVLSLLVAVSSSTPMETNAAIVSHYQTGITVADMIANTAQGSIAQYNIG